MHFRLGMYECPECGYFVSAKEVAAREEQRPDDGINRRRLIQPKRAGAAPVPPSFASLPFDPQPVPPSLSGEKATFLAVYFCVMVATSFLVRAQYLSVAEMAGALPSMLFGALLLTLTAGFVLHYDNDCLRQGCMWWIGTAVVLGFFGAALAVPTKQLYLAWPLVPHLAMNVWLFTLLWRDRRSE